MSPRRRGAEPARILGQLLGLVGLVALGFAAFVAGEADDSPGLQGIGAILVVGAVALGVRAVRRSSTSG